MGADPSPAAPQPELSAASAAPVEYNVTVEKNKGDPSVSLDLEALGTTPRVKSLNSGVLTKYNSGTTDANKIQIGDFLYNVNGQQGDADKMLDAISSASKLQMKFKRPIEFVAVLDKAG